MEAHHQVARHPPVRRAGVQRRRVNRHRGRSHRGRPDGHRPRGHRHRAGPRRHPARHPGRRPAPRHLHSTSPLPAPPTPSPWPAPDDAPAPGLRTRRRVAAAPCAAASQPTGVPRPRRRIPWLALLGVRADRPRGGGCGRVGRRVLALRLRAVLRAARPTARSRSAARATTSYSRKEPARPTADLPPPLAITVVDERGHSVPVEPLIAPGTSAAPFAYHVPPNEGRAIARFTAPRRGRYLLQVQRLDPRTHHCGELPIRPAVEPGRGAGVRCGLACAPRWGLLVLAGVPLAGGVVVLMIGAPTRSR